MKDIRDYDFKNLCYYLKKNKLPYTMGQDGEDIDNLIPYIRFEYMGCWNEIREIEKLLKSIEISKFTKDQFIEILLSFSSKI